MKSFKLALILILLGVPGYSQTAQEFFEAATKKEDLGDYNGAISNYSKAIEIEPNFIDAIFSRGISREKIGDVLNALSDYNHALELDSSNPLFYFRRSGIRGKYLLDFEGAIEDCTKGIEYHSDSHDDWNLHALYVNRGYFKNKIEDFTGAIKDLNEAIKINSENSNAYVNRGSSKENLGDIRGAILDYSKAIQFDPENAQAYSNRGKCKGMLENYESGILDLNKQ